MKKRGEGDSGITVSSLIGLIIGLLIFVPFLLYGCKVFNESQLAGESLKDFKEFVEGLKDGESDYISIYLEKDETLFAFDESRTLKFSDLKAFSTSEDDFKNKLKERFKNGENFVGKLITYTPAFKTISSCKPNEVCLCACNEVEVPNVYGGDFSCNEKSLECESITKPILVMGIGMESFGNSFVYTNVDEKGYYSFFAERVGNTIYICEEKQCYLKFECSNYNRDTCLNNNGCYVGVDGKCASCSDITKSCDIYYNEKEFCDADSCKIGCYFQKELGDEKGKCLPTSPGFIEY